MIVGFIALGQGQSEKTCSGNIPPHLSAKKVNVIASAEKKVTSVFMGDAKGILFNGCLQMDCTINEELCQMNEASTKVYQGKKRKKKRPKAQWFH